MLREPTRAECLAAAAQRLRNLRRLARHEASGIRSRAINAEVRGLVRALRLARAAI
jgi:hypothetical protein